MSRCSQSASTDSYGICSISNGESWVKNNTSCTTSTRSIISCSTTTSDNEERRDEIDAFWISHGDCWVMLCINVIASLI